MLASILSGLTTAGRSFLNLFKPFMQMNSRIAAAIQPLLTRAPWLAYMLQPLSWLNPLFAVVEALLLVASIPYAIAAVAAAAMFVYSFVVEFVAHAIASTLGLFDEMKETFGDNYHHYWRERRNIWNDNSLYFLERRSQLAVNFGKLLVYQAAALVSNVVMFAVTTPVVTLWYAVHDAAKSARQFANDVLDTGVMRLMRKPWEKIFGAMRPSTVDSLGHRIHNINVDVMHNNHLIGRISQALRYREDHRNWIETTVHLDRLEALERSVQPQLLTRTAAPALPQTLPASINELTSALNQHADMLDQHTTILNQLGHTKKASWRLSGSKSQPEAARAQVIAARVTPAPTPST